MAFNLSDAGITDLSTITLNTFAASNASNLNSYARVTAMTGDDITIDTATQTAGAYEQFTVGNEILIHVSATQNSNYKKYLGRWAVATILSANGGILTLNRDFTQILPADEFAHYYVQAITIAHFDTLKIDSGTSIIPKAYSASTYTGGIVALKCNTLNLNGGHIDLRDRGIPTTAKDLRPWTNLEAQAKLDTDPYSGWENAETRDRFMLNVGDGAAFLITLKEFAYGSEREGTYTIRASRIGNPSTSGAFACRGASNSPNLPEGVTNIGGSTILAVLPPFVSNSYGGNGAWVSNSFGGNDSFKIFAKYRSSSSAEGQGLARCYVACIDGPTTINNWLWGDGGLAASDNVHTDKARNEFNIGVVGFGDGSFGAVSNYTGQLNNYAKVTQINGATITYTGKTTSGLAPIQAGALIMVHLMHPTDRTSNGAFSFHRVLSDNGSQLTVTPSIVAQPTGTVSHQIVSIPEFSDFTLNETNSATPKYTDQVGGICAIAVNGTCDLSGGKLNVEGKGGSWNNSFTHTAQAFTYVRMPIGQGHGSVFILARNLIMNEDTRIGATYTGDWRGGDGYAAEAIIYNNYNTDSGGYCGSHKSRVDSSLDNQVYTEIAGPGNTVGSNCGFGSGFSGGYEGGNQYGGFTTFYRDGFHGNGTGSKTYSQGAHIMIIANTITNFTIAALSTGGQGYGAKTVREQGTTSTYYPIHTHGGCGYGGGGTCEYSITAKGGYHGGGGGNEAGGGAAGLAFVYCNTAVNQNLSGITIEDDA